MMPADILPPDLSRAADDLRAREQPFAFATIIRTAGATAAKPGAKALLNAEGDILQGWLGGGCTRSAVKKAVLEALRDGRPQLISVAPEEFLSAKGVAAGDEVDGMRYARNGCPSKGTVDIFIEPCMPLPELVVYGVSPVAKVLRDFAPKFQWGLTLAEPDSKLAPPAPPRRRVVIVATQGQGDFVALRNALESEAEHIAFVGSREKYAALATKLADAGLPRDAIEAVSAPAGLDIGAVTPEEIALSIFAELTRVRRIPSREAHDT
jgi:xanthine dehydrogenase accessory factor